MRGFSGIQDHSLLYSLEEIKKGRGKLYDPKVVDTCIKLVKNKKSGLWITTVTTTKFLLTI